jgi:hypothetical protein
MQEGGIQMRFDKANSICYYYIQNKEQRQDGVFQQSGITE